MTDDDIPPANRTVFRPSPLQGLKGGAAAPPPPPTGGADPPLPPVQAAPDPRLRPDDVPKAPKPAPARNPMMAEAASFLALVASVRAGRASINLPELHQKASTAIAAWELAMRGRCADEHLQRGRYALCATIDDVAMNLPGQEGDAAVWAQRSMVVRFFGENIGGDRFWSLLDDMIARPAEFRDVLELYHACMASGFEGRYRVSADGKRAHQELMRRAFLSLEHPRTVSMTELSPHWKGEQTDARKPTFWAPLALAAGAALLLLLLIYIVLRLILAGSGAPSLTALKAINPDQPLRLSRVAPAPPVPAAGAQALRIRTFLAPEISQGLVQVIEDASTVRVRTTVGQLFRSGSDQLDSERLPLFDRIGGAIETEPGPVRVEGYTDNTRIHTISFPDNLALSRARADTVAGRIRSKLSDAGRVTAEGYGDSDPIASNDTADGRTSNRRVEVVIQRKD